MTVTIGRRELLVALGGAVTMWPLTAGVQRKKPSRSRRRGDISTLANPEVVDDIRKTRS